MSAFLSSLIGQKPLIIDGGLSNVLEAQGCDLNHKLWTARLILEQPEAIVNAHLRYLEAGANIITTSSYQASVKGLMEEGIDEQEAISVLLKSVTLAEEAVERFMKSSADSGRPLIAASIGPYGAYLADGSEYTGAYGLSDKALAQFHARRLELLANSNADLVACETLPCQQEAKVLSRLLEKIEKPSWVSFSCKDDGHISDGTPIEEVASLFSAHPSVMAIGVNCTQPQFVSGLIRKIKNAAPDKKIVVYPNSGETYDPIQKSWMSVPDVPSFAEMSKVWQALGADLMGGCCRIGPEQISALANLQG